MKNEPLTVLLESAKLFWKKELSPWCYIFRAEGHPTYFMDDYDGEDYLMDRKHPLLVVFVSSDPANDFEKRLPILAMDESDGTFYSCWTDTGNGWTYGILEETNVEIIGHLPELADVIKILEPYAESSIGDVLSFKSKRTGEVAVFEYDYSLSFMKQPADTVERIIDFAKSVLPKPVTEKRPDAETVLKRDMEAIESFRKFANGLSAETWALKDRILSGKKSDE